MANFCIQNWLSTAYKTVRKCFPIISNHFLNFPLNNNHSIDEKFKPLKYNFNDTSCMSQINRRLWLRKARFPTCNWRWCSTFWDCALNGVQPTQIFLNLCKIAKDLHLHGNFSRITDSLFYASFFLSKVSQVKSHYVGLRWPAAIFFSRKCCLTQKLGNILSYSQWDLMPYEILNVVFLNAKY